MDGIHPAVDADSRVMVAAVLTMDSEFAYGLGHGIVAGKERAAVARAAEWFAGEKAGGADG